jgi:hypothetical protein
MKNILIILLFVPCLLKGQSNKNLIPEESFLNDNRMIIKDFPKSELPKNINGLFITVYSNKDAITIHGKCANGYVLLDSLIADFYYNPDESIEAKYMDGYILVVSGMPMNESEAIAKFKFSNGKLSFIVTDVYNPNEGLEIDIEKALKKGDIKEASELYLGVQSPPWGYLENAQLILLERAHEVGMEYAKNKEFKKAAETMGYAYDFYTGINEEFDIIADSKEAKYIADYTYLLLNVPDYKKCIEVCRVIIKLSPNLAGPYLHLGNSLYATDSKDEAKKAYEKYIAIRKSKNEESRVPKYVYERLNISKEKPDVVVYKFFKWYFDNKINVMELTNWTDEKAKFYRVNFSETEKYLKELQSSGFVSKIYIDNWRGYFKKCDESFLKNKQNEGPPDGFEFDFITNSQEYPEKVLPSDFKLIEIKGQKAKVKYADYLVYLLQLEESGWKITGIEND